MHSGRYYAVNCMVEDAREGCADLCSTDSASFGQDHLRSRSGDIRAAQMIAEVLNAYPILRRENALLKKEIARLKSLIPARPDAGSPHAPAINEVMKMTTKAEWLALVDRVEKATGPDREIDLAVARIFNVVVMRRNDDDTGNEEHTYWNITESLDAITEMFERELPETRILMSKEPDGTLQIMEVWNCRRARELGLEYDAILDMPALPPAIALCSAFCRAMAEKAGEP